MVNVRSEVYREPTRWRTVTAPASPSRKPIIARSLPTSSRALSVIRRRTVSRSSDAVIACATPSLAVAVESRVLQRQGRLMRERLHELDLAGRERADVVPICDERTEDPL